MGSEQVLDLARADVLALADDDVLRATRDAEVALGVERSQIAGAEPAVAGEGLGVERPVEIAEEALRTAGEDLALATRRHRTIVVAHHADLDGADRATLAVDAAGRRVGRAGRRDGGKFGGPVDALRDAGGPVGRLGDERWIGGGGAPGEGPGARNGRG